MVEGPDDEPDDAPDDELDDRLFMMIGFAAQDGHGAVELLDEEEAHHLVGEGHEGEGELFGGQGVDGGGESVGAADYEHEAPGHLALLLLKIGGKLDGTVFASSFVEEHDVVAGAELLLQEFAFALFLLLGGEGLGVLEFGDDFHVEGDIVLDALGIVGDEGREVLVDGAAHYEEEYFHGDEIKKRVSTSD